MGMQDITSSPHYDESNELAKIVTAHRKLAVQGKRDR